MPVPPDDETLRRLRLAAQRLAPGTHASDPSDAVRTVVGVQAQDVRAAALALRSRVPGLRRAAVDASGLVRTWTVRGTVHLIAEEDRPWLHAVTASRNRRRFERLLADRGGLELARAMLPDVVAVLRELPRTRAALLAALAARGHPPLDPSSVNVLVPWVAAQGVVVGLPDGRLRAADPPAPVDEEEALATLAVRYLTGYGPATAADLAKWSGIPLGTARRALAAADGVEALGDLRAVAGAFDADPPPSPAALLLAAFDTLMLGHARREPFLASTDDRRVLRGGGIVRAVALAHGRVTGTWGLQGSGSRRRVVVEWFGEPAPEAALCAEAVDVVRFLAAD